jgi:hypothetical protein
MYDNMGNISQCIMIIWENISQCIIIIWGTYHNKLILEYFPLPVARLIIHAFVHFPIILENIQQFNTHTFQSNRS